MSSSGTTPWNLINATPPWRSSVSVSIYSYIRKHIGRNGQLDEAASRLPDEVDDDRIKFVAGGLDSLVAGGANTDRAKMMYRALQVVLEDASPTKLERLYEQLLQQGAIEFIDPLMEEIVQRKDLDPERLERLAGWIAQNAPDREPIKFALALLGVVGSSKYDEVIATLGRHEEFTLYAVVAFGNIGAADAETKIFDLAKHVHGWGRIHAVHRLAETTNPDIKRWFLYDGYKNYILYEYLAYTCAVAGELRRELEKEAVDPELLVSAAEILQSLFMGGPAEDMGDYDDGAIVVQRYVQHLGDAPQDLRHLKAIESIEEYLEDDSDLQARAEKGWTTKVRDKLLWRVKALKESPHWKDRILADLKSTDDAVFHRASSAARIVGIDVWPYHFARLESGKDNSWYYVMQSNDVERIDRVLTLAERTLPLDQIASGPAKVLGFSSQWKPHNELDFVLQDLVRFPGKGWRLLRAGLRSPLVRNRHLALRAFATWEKSNWPEDAETYLQTLVNDEVDDDLKSKIQRVLAGLPFSDPEKNLDDEDNDGADDEEDDEPTDDA